MLEVAGLNAWYGESHILHGVDFEVREGEVVTLLGRNGAGKTTTLKSIMGLVPRREGSIDVPRSRMIDLMPNHIARSGIAFCPEERGIFGSLSVTENLVLPPVVRARRAGCRHDLHAVSQPEGTRAHGAWHAAFGRRTADAGDRAHPAHRRQAAAAGRADRGTGAGDRAADRPHRRARSSSAASPCCWSSRISASPQTVADRHYVMEHGQVIDMIANAQLEANMDKLHEYLGRMTCISTCPRKWTPMVGSRRRRSRPVSRSQESLHLLILGRTNSHEYFPTRSPGARPPRLHCRWCVPARRASRPSRSAC